MRLKLSRRVTTGAVCAALVLGTAAPAAAHELPRDTGADSTAAPAPGPAAPTAPTASTAPTAPASPASETKPLADVGDLLKPVAELVKAALKAPGGELSPADIEKHTKAIRDAVAALKATADDDALADVVVTVQKTTDSLLEPATEAEPQQP
ncbi:hypothetical protein ABTZ59_02970 [Streptomyces sp. NPDC094034]|uniref:hypothetical protein n=1 Tax=Streptomyces sp. NPDC094034 TaxID=3155309 RepID=UPI00331CAEC4